jgi:hypothetical protein
LVALDPEILRHEPPIKRKMMERYSLPGREAKPRAVEGLFEVEMKGD